MNRPRQSHWTLCAALCLCVAGCGKADDTPPLSPVTGTVTLDGAPLPNANVQFQPSGTGGASNGKTDATGRYVLYYGATSQHGAALGSHQVRVNCYGEDGDTMDRVPAKYNTNTTLTRDVISGENVIDLQLTSR